jgi:hypothetical protein
MGQIRNLLEEETGEDLAGKEEGKEAEKVGETGETEVAPKKRPQLVVRDP